MLTLYGKTGCPYTKKVVDTLDTLGLSFMKKNIAQEEVANELIEKGGKRQVPYLTDDDFALYESDAIVEYINNTYGEGRTELSVHNTTNNNTCTPF